MQNDSERYAFLWGHSVNRTGSLDCKYCRPLIRQDVCAVWRCKLCLLCNRSTCQYLPTKRGSTCGFKQTGCPLKIFVPSLTPVISGLLVLSCDQQYKQPSDKQTSSCEFSGDDLQRRGLKLFALVLDEVGTGWAVFQLGGVFARGVWLSFMIISDRVFETCLTCWERQSLMFICSDALKILSNSIQHTGSALLLHSIFNEQRRLC